MKLPEWIFEIDSKVELFDYIGLIIDIDNKILYCNAEFLEQLRDDKINDLLK